MGWRKYDYRKNPIYKLYHKQVGVELYKAELKAEEETRKIIMRMFENTGGTDWVEGETPP